MNIIDNPTDVIYPNFDVPRRPAHIARDVMDAHYGLTTPYGEPDEEGREGFERAQAETLAETGEFIDADTVLGLIREGIEADRRAQAAAPSAREPMLSAQDLAAQLNMSVPTIYHRHARGEDLPRALQLTRGGALRWRQSDVDAWVEAHLDPLP